MGNPTPSNRRRFSVELTQAARNIGLAACFFRTKIAGALRNPRLQSHEKLSLSLSGSLNRKAYSGVSVRIWS
jgi:hypothetical protein